MGLEVAPTWSETDAGIGRNTRTAESSFVGAGWKTLDHDINRKLWLLESDSLSAETRRRTRQPSRCEKENLVDHF